MRLSVTGVEKILRLFKRSLVPEVSAEYIYSHSKAEANRYILGQQQKLGEERILGASQDSLRFYGTKWSRIQ